MYLHQETLLVRRLRHSNVAQINYMEVYSAIESPPPVLLWMNVWCELAPDNETDRDLEIDMEHESDTDYPIIDKRYLNNKPSNWYKNKVQALWPQKDEVASLKKTKKRECLFLSEMMKCWE